MCPYSFISLGLIGVEGLDHMVYITFKVLSYCFQSGCTILHSYQQCMRILVAPHILQHLKQSVFLMLTILIGVPTLFYCFALVSIHMVQKFKKKFLRCIVKSHSHLCLPTLPSNHFCRYLV